MSTGKSSVGTGTIQGIQRRVKSCIWLYVRFDAPYITALTGWPLQIDHYSDADLFIDDVAVKEASRGWEGFKEASRDWPDFTMT